MKKTRGETCALCGGAATTYQTDTIRVFDRDEEFKGVTIAWHKFQRRKCAVCGAEGRTPVFIGKTEWEESFSPERP